MMPIRKNTPTLMIVAIAAILFGLITIASGGRGLFGDAAARAGVGNAVGFVLWFNFVAGFAYVVAGAGLLMAQRWAFWLALLIAASTLVIFAAFGIHIWLGGVFEMRTVGAMTFRSLVWIIIAIFGFRVRVGSTH